MQRIETARLIGLSEILIEHGKILSYSSPVASINLLNIKPTTGREAGFVFYVKENTLIPVCHIGITWQRNRTEVSYGTEPDYRRCGFTFFGNVEGSDTQKWYRFSTGIE